MPSDVIFLVILQRKFEIDLSGVKGLIFNQKFIMIKLIEPMTTAGLDLHYRLCYSGPQCMTVLANKSTWWWYAMCQVLAPHVAQGFNIMMGSSSPFIPKLKIEVHSPNLF